MARTCTTRSPGSTRSGRCSSSRRKTFTTDETMTNAHSARAWIADALGDKAVNDHFAARLDQPQGLRRLRHPAGPHLRLLGLGGRPLFGVVGHRPAGRDRRRLRQFRGVPQRRLRDGPAFPQDPARQEPAGDHGRCSASGTATPGASRRTRCCPTTSGCRAFRPTCSSRTWRATASR